MKSLKSSLIPSPRFKFELFSARKSISSSAICPDSDTLCNCFYSSNLCISLVFSEAFLFASVRLYCKFFTCVSNSFILFVLLALLTLFEFLIIVFSSLSFWFSFRRRVLIPSILIRLSFSLFISMSTLPGVISETSAGVQYGHVYFLFFLIKLYEGRSEQF